MDDLIQRLAAAPNHRELLLTSSLSGNPATWSIAAVPMEQWNTSRAGMRLQHMRLDTLWKRHHGALLRYVDCLPGPTAIAPTRPERLVDPAFPGMLRA